MAWLDGWLYRMPIAIDNTTAAATHDVTIPIPGDLDLFWDTIDSLGDELRLTNADGITVLTVFEGHRLLRESDVDEG